MAFWAFLKKSQSTTNAEDAKPEHTGKDKAYDREFDNPWRKITWEKSEIIEEIKEFPLCNPQVKNLRLLLNGPVGAGKSSFINSVNGAFQNRVTSKAIMLTSSETSCTRAYRGYKIKNGTSGTLSFIFYDIMGLETGENEGVLPDDVNSALQGHVPDGYQFNSDSRLTAEDTGYINKPPMEEKTHCLICVVSGNSISQMPVQIIKKTKQIIKEATKLGIPQVVIMTMIDQVCPLVKKDLRNVYKSKKIRKKMEECSANLSIPLTCIFPVKNYHEETETNEDMDVLLLSAMKHILHFANDFTEVL